ncbi:unnamed protein product [Brassica napus]|uniref:(rape) hypothetical protein n=1 Tax=Brassica napus TaxID=3708 RepID=A0A816L3F6_BRANA|nr:unnamed protein product [Brassica napus]
MDVMLISSCNLYPFVDESPFVEREYHEIYREIYGDPIYDVYEDDEIYKEICRDPIYDVYEKNDFDNLVRAKIGQNLVYIEDFKHNQARAIFVQKQFYEEFGSVSFKTLNIEVQCIESYNQTCLLVRDLEFSDIGYMKSNLNGGAVQVNDTVDGRWSGGCSEGQTGLEVTVAIFE